MMGIAGATEQERIADEKKTVDITDGMRERQLLVVVASWDTKICRARETIWLLALLNPYDLL